MDRRELILSLLDPGAIPEHVPAAFFLHFEPGCHAGRAAVEKHLEFFRATAMDFVKIQYEHPFPQRRIARPEDWRLVPRLDEAFFSEPLAVVAGLVREAKRDAVVVTTLYSPFMCAGQVAGDAVRDRHLREDPAAVPKGLEIITESRPHSCEGASRPAWAASTSRRRAAKPEGSQTRASSPSTSGLSTWSCGGSAREGRRST
jgi:uroporphyrinogen decarboxylase